MAIKYVALKDTLHVSAILFETRINANSIFKYFDLRAMFKIAQNRLFFINVGLSEAEGTNTYLGL